MIKEKNLKHWIENFYGYGSWKASIWFVAYEESGGDTPEDVAERINFFAKHHPNDSSLFDIRNLYKNVQARLSGPRANAYKTLYDYRFGRSSIIHGLWKNLIAFAHGFKNKKLPDLHSYQRKSFLLPTSQEALIQLYPLPSPHNHAWYYSWLLLPKLEFIRDRQAYQDYLFDNRIQTIIQNIEKFKPEVVLMFGMENVNRLKESFSKKFQGVTFKSSKIIKQVLPQYHEALIGKTKLIITTQVPTLRHNRVETGFDWYALGKKIRNENY